MNILITGAQGFIGRNLVAALCSIRDGQDKTTAVTADFNLLEYDVDAGPAVLDRGCREADFVFHLVGVSRPKDPSEFWEGNVRFTSTLLEGLKKHGNVCPVLFSSSTQAALDNPYGRSKKTCEELLFSYGKETGARVLVYRLPNVFGKWGRPNYNSVVATFCHNIARGLPIKIHDRDVEMALAYIDDVIAELIHALDGWTTCDGGYGTIPITYQITVGAMTDLLYEFKEHRNEHRISNMTEPFVKKLYATYLSYLPKDQFRYPLTMHTDERGSFTEVFRTADWGQFSVNITKPGCMKGNHWHHTKCEKFLVVSGSGIIRFRQYGKTEILEYHVSGDRLEMVDVPPGYTHSLENLGPTDMVTLMWSSESFNPEQPDTFFLEV